jgi:hypothetical protein
MNPGARDEARTRDPQLGKTPKAPEITRTSALVSVYRSSGRHREASRASFSAPNVTRRHQEFTSRKAAGLFARSCAQAPQDAAGDAKNTRPFRRRRASCAAVTGSRIRGLAKARPSSHRWRILIPLEAQACVAAETQRITSQSSATGPPRPRVRGTRSGPASAPIGSGNNRLSRAPPPGHCPFASPLDSDSFPAQTPLPNALPQSKRRGNRLAEAAPDQYPARHVLRIRASAPLKRVAHPAGGEPVSGSRRGTGRDGSGNRASLGSGRGREHED